MGCCQAVALLPESCEFVAPTQEVWCGPQRLIATLAHQKLIEPVFQTPALRGLFFKNFA